jgi:hypothetical protein
MAVRQLRLVLVSVMSCAGGCPSEIDPASLAAKPVAKAVDETDPRVVRDGDDLYPAASIERAKEGTRQEPPPGLGSGKPDETNGKCRLFAPKLPDPECCKSEWGFDVDTVQKACELELFLGESWQYSCGYYFHKTGSAPIWFRMGHLPDADPKAAAAAHDQKLRDLTNNPAYASTPVPGVEGALWSEHDGTRWAFIPGWDKARQLSWKSGTCSEAGIIEIIQKLASAKQPAKGAERPGLLPKARM